MHTLHLLIHKIYFYKYGELNDIKYSHKIIKYVKNQDFVYYNEEKMSIEPVPELTQV